MTYPESRAEHVRDWCLAFALFPRTWLHALLRPRLLLCRSLTDARVASREYTPPTLFALTNVVAAMVVGHLSRDPESLNELTKQAAIHRFGFGLLALLAGNVLLLGILALLLRFGRSQVKQALSVLAYGSVVFVPGTAMSTILFHEETWQERMWGAFAANDLVLLARLSPGMWVALLGLLIVGVLWLAFLTVGLRLLTGRRTRLVLIRLTAGLSLLLAVEFLAFSVPCWVRLATFAKALVAYGELQKSPPRVEARDSYRHMETVLRNIADADGFTPAQRYYAQAHATLLFLARAEAALGVVAAVRGTEHWTRGATSQMARLARGPDWPELESLLATRIQAAAKPSADDHLQGMPDARVLEQDLEHLQYLRSLPALGGAHPPAIQSFNIMLYVVPRGAYLSLWPRALSGPPSVQYGFALVRELPGQRNMVQIKWTTKNPMLHRVREAYPVVR